MSKRNKFEYYLKKYLTIPLKILRISIVDTIRQDGIEHAGYLAFLSVLSIFPFMIFLISIVGFVGGSDIGAQMIFDAVNSLPNQAAQAILPRVKEIVSGPKQDFLTVAIIGVIWTASSSVEGLRTILNRAYRVHLPPPYIFRRLISILEFFIITFSITAVIMFFVIFPHIINYIHIDFIQNLVTTYNLPKIHKIFIFIFLACAVSIIYYAIPNVKQQITRTFPGAVLTVILWTITQKLFLFYINQFDQFNFVYGSLAGITIYLMFFYLVNLIFIIGAEFNYHLYRVYQILLKE